MDKEKFADKEKVKLVLKIVTNEQEKEDFIKTLFPADIEVKRLGQKIVTVADYKNNFLYVFKKPIEGHVTIDKFSEAYELTLSKTAHEAMLFYSEVAKLVAVIEARGQEEEVKDEE